MLGLEHVTILVEAREGQLTIVDTFGIRHRPSVTHEPIRMNEEIGAQIINTENLIVAIDVDESASNHCYLFVDQRVGGNQFHPGHYRSATLVTHRLEHFGNPEHVLGPPFDVDAQIAAVIELSLRHTFPYWGMVS